MTAADTKKKEAQKFPWTITTTKFTEHLKSKNNKRIIFSGRFGIGKTTFLQDFFASAENQNKYFVTHLFPVNYQISHNENIIKFLKADIAASVLEKHKEIDADLLMKLYFTMKQINPISFINKTIGFSDIIDGFLESFEEIQLPAKIADKLAQNIKNIPTEKEQIEKEIEKINELRFTNPDWFTNWIKEEIEKISTEEKKSVLILDDLDRLDPEHIFRILNVFSALGDQADKDQKILGYDKIIVVCDLKNIQHIFEHKYGSKTDFGGYIDKFYSINPFHVDAYEQIVTALKGQNEDGIIYKIFDTIERDNPELKDNLDKDVFVDLMFFLVVYLLRTKQLNMRELTKFVTYEAKNLFEEAFWEKYKKNLQRLLPDKTEEKKYVNSSAAALKIIKKIKQKKFLNLSFYKKKDWEFDDQHQKNTLIYKKYGSPFSSVTEDKTINNRKIEFGLLLLNALTSDKKINETINNCKNNNNGEIKTAIYHGIQFEFSGGINSIFESNIKELDDFINQ